MSTEQIPQSTDDTNPDAASQLAIAFMWCFNHLDAPPENTLDFLAMALQSIEEELRNVVQRTAGKTVAIRMALPHIIDFFRNQGGEPWRAEADNRAIWAAAWEARNA
jgi:hypothetical protein